MSRESFKRSMLQWAVGIVATVFLMTPARAGAAGAAYDACSQCHQGLTFAQCAGIVNYTISSCCGGGGGWAWCVNSEWGFYASCKSEVGSGECQCDKWGNNCDSGFREGKEKEY